MTDGHQLWYLGVVSNVRVMIPPSMNRRSGTSEHNSSYHHRNSNTGVRLRSTIMDNDVDSDNDDIIVHNQQHMRSSEVQLIDRIEAAQLDGKLPTNYRDTESSNQPCPFVSLHLSKHGLKIVNVNNMEVVDRLSLNSLVQAVSFSDGMGNFNVAIKVAESRCANNSYLCYVFQAKNENDADDVCKRLRSVFQSVVVH